MNSKLYVALLTCLLIGAPVLAQEFVIYPTQGQSTEQMEQDKFQCYSWSKNESGFDPMAPPTASEPPPQKEAQKGGTGRGAVRWWSYCWYSKTKRPKKAGIPTTAAMGTTAGKPVHAGSQ